MNNVLLKEKDFRLELISGDANADFICESGIDEGQRFTFALVQDLPNEKIRAIGKCTFTAFPGNRFIIISSGLEIHKEFRGWGGFNKIFWEMRYKLAKEMGATKIMATVRMDNIKQVSTMVKNNWNFIKTFDCNGSLCALVEKDVK